MRMSYSEEQRVVAATIARFPAQFGLRASPGKVFCINLSASFMNDAGTEVMLYTFVKNTAAEADAPPWLAYAKGTEEELRRELVLLPGHPWPTPHKAP